MSRYDRQFDFGLRGYRQTTRPLTDHAPRWDDSAGRPRIEERADPDERLAHRVTARYNADYLAGHRPDPYDEAFRPFADDDAGRPRGTSMAYEYDYPAYGPGYRRRRPNDL